MKKIVSILLVSTFLPMLWSAEEGNNTLNVIVNGASPGVGQAILYLFDSEATYLKKPLKTKTMPIGDKGSVRFVLEGLDKGDYAVNVVYDEDSDGKLDKGLFGFPTELIGFSKNAKCRLVPPSFSEVKFDIPKTREVVINLGKVKK